MAFIVTLLSVAMERFFVVVVVVF